MELGTAVRILVLLIVAVVIITWLDNRSIAAKAQQEFATREPAEHTIFVVCPVIAKTQDQVSDAIKNIVRLVKDARWPEALSIGIVYLANKHLPEQDLDVRVASQCRVLGMSNVHVRCERYKLPSDKQLRRNRSLHSFSTLEYARKMCIRRLYNREDYLLLYDPLTATTEPWWDSTSIDSHKQAMKEGHQRPIITCVPQFQGIYAFDRSPEFIARVSKGVDPLTPMHTTMWVCPWFAFIHSRFAAEELPFDVSQPDDMQITALAWSRVLSKRSWTPVLPLLAVATGQLVRNGPFDQQRLQRFAQVEQCCIHCGHPRITHTFAHPFQPPF